MQILSLKKMNEKLVHKPNGYYVNELGETVKIPRIDIARALQKEYNHIRVILDNNEISNINDIRIKIEKLKSKELIILLDSNMNALDYCFYDNNDAFNRNTFRNANDDIKNGHKRYNASKDFKMRQANGNKKNQAFKLYAMNYQG